MRRGCPGLILCASALCTAAPAEARDGPRAPPAHNPALTGIRQLPPGRAAPLASQNLRIRFANDSIIRQEGAPGNRRAVVGSMPLVGRLDAEVGLFSVSGASAKEREVKRMDPMGDIQPRRSRVAAIGLRMSF